MLPSPPPTSLTCWPPPSRPGLCLSRRSHQRHWRPPERWPVIWTPARARPARRFSSPARRSTSGAGSCYPHLYVAPALLAADRIVEARAGLQSGRKSALQRNLRVAVPAYDGLLALCDFLEGRWDDAALASARRERTASRSDPAIPNREAPFAHSSPPPAANDPPTTAIDRPKSAPRPTASPCCASSTPTWPQPSSNQRGTLSKLVSSVGGTAAVPPAGLRSTVGPEAGQPVVGDRRWRRRPGSGGGPPSTRRPRPIHPPTRRRRGPSRGTGRRIARAAPCRGRAEHEDSPRRYERAGGSKTPASSWPRTTPNAPGSSSTIRPRHYDDTRPRATPPASSTACRAAGLRPRRKRSSRPRFGWEALTPTELRVVDEVAHGHTTGSWPPPCTSSRYTVESHLKHIFAKLGVRSRAEVAAQGALHRS